jgi:uncharacterized protein (TIGR02466 family)
MIESWFHVSIFYKDFDDPKIQEELGNAISNVEIKSADTMWNDTVQTSFTYSNNNRLLESCPHTSSIIYNSILEYLEIFNFQHDNEILIKDSWVNITERGQFQHYHVHTGNDISGVFYYQSSGLQEEGNIVFKTPSPVCAQSKLLYFEPNQVFYPPKQGRLILFPSFLEHAVMPNKTDNKRISVSFNADINGNIQPKENNA